jgi:hypothetical protein
VAEQTRLVFLPVNTDYHLTNYKPDFMLAVLAGPAARSDAAFYFDPDICAVANWAFFEEWAQCGVALSEDVNSPLPENHPRRVGWRRYFTRFGLALSFHSQAYVNGGFVGVCRADFEFLALWKRIQELMAPEIGGLGLSAFPNAPMATSKLHDLYMFSRTDQDALNVCCEAYSGSLSVIGKEAMSFASGPRVMGHALGHPKPWSGRLLGSSLRGRRPSQAQQDYWRYCNALIRSRSAWDVGKARLYMGLAGITSRVYGHV